MSRAIYTDIDGKTYYGTVVGTLRNEYGDMETVIKPDGGNGVCLTVLHPSRVSMLMEEGSEPSGDTTQRWRVGGSEGARERARELEHQEQQAKVAEELLETLRTVAEEIRALRMDLNGLAGRKQ